MSLRRRMVVSAIALTLAVPLLGAVQADASTNPVVSRLSKAQRSDFISKAEKVGHLTSAQANAAADDPTLLQAVTTSVTDTVTVVPDGVKTKSVVTGSAKGIKLLGKVSLIGPPYLPPGCSTATATHSSTNWLGVELAKFTVQQYFCYGGGAVTYAPQANVWANVPNAGSIVGVQYAGVSSASDWFYSYDGFNTGGHQTYRFGLFPVCIARIGCYTNHNQWIQLFVHYDATADAHFGGG